LVGSKDYFTNLNVNLVDTAAQMPPNNRMQSDILPATRAKSC